LERHFLILLVRTDAILENLDQLDTERLWHFVVNVNVGKLAAQSLLTLGKQVEKSHK
jgi:hypothetical protein